MRGLLNYITYLSSIPGGLGDSEGGLPARGVAKTFHFDNAIGLSKSFIFDSAVQ